LRQFSLRDWPTVSAARMLRSWFQRSRVSSWITKRWFMSYSAEWQIRQSMPCLASSGTSPTGIIFSVAG
jgi:hypothetical protein